MSEQNKALLRRWFDEVWNKGNAQAIGEIVTDDVAIHGLSDASGTPITSITEFRNYHTQLRNAFPDIVVDVDNLIAEGDMVAARCSVRGRHSGELLGLAPTNSAVDFDGMVIVKVSDGKIVEAWNCFDFLRMSQQLGML
jgi:steroid delta-isomerase-like uncharacterized protein